MRYYTRRKKHKYIPFLIVIIIIFILFNAIIAVYNKAILPAVKDVAETMVKSKALDEINKTSMEVLSNEFRYDQMIKVEKDNDGNINLIQADTG